MSLGKSRKIINLKKESGDLTIQRQFDTVNGASKGSINGAQDSRGNIKSEGLAVNKVIDYVPNHNQA